MRGLRGQCDIQAQMAAKDHVWACGSTAARVCVDIHVPCYHRRPQGCPGSGLPPMVMLVSEAHATTRVMPI